MVTKLIGIKEFRQNISTLYKKAQKNNWCFIVLNRNKPIFRVEPLSEKDVILEELARDIDEARDDVKHGRVYTAEQIRNELSA
jgi:hypothetical protein